MHPLGDAETPHPVDVIVRDQRVDMNAQRGHGVSGPTATADVAFPPENDGRSQQVLEGSEHHCRRRCT